MVCMTAADYLADLNRDYERLHTAKEDAFWTAYMGLSPDAAAARADYDRREIELKRFLQDPARLADVRAQREAAERGGEPAETLTSLRGWEATFGAHAIESADARALAEEIVAAEGALAGARGGMKLGFTDPASKQFTPASSVRLGAMLLSETDEARRRAAWEGLRSIEPCVLEHGFVELVRMRNRLGRMLGGEDYYDAVVRRVERLTKARIFGWLDELERATRDAARRSIDELSAQHGARATPWNVRAWSTGDTVREQDPYFPFGPALLRWGRSMSALGVRYAGATLVLDLVDRKGKHENGFMHGPVPAWREGGRWRPARIQFTANAVPGLSGAGRRATDTLFHEGGHAAHYANIDMPAPCFSQEFAPSSVAFSETQSMFMDSLVGDADWQARYATTRDGAAMGDELILRGVRARQPLAAWELRQRLSVCYGEKAIYEIPDAELSPQRILDALRDVERRLLFLDEGSPRPILSVPHLLSGESSAYYHGYVLAEMAVQQTRAHFLARDGYLTDNPALGPALRDAYWRPGNSRSFAELVSQLTGAPPSAGPLAREVSRTADEAAADARARLQRGRSVPRRDGPVELDASVRVIHGTELVAATDGPATGGRFEDCARRFEAWIAAQGG
jgi:Peptidase family M3